MEIEHDVLGTNVVLTPRNVEEIYRSFLILETNGECGRKNILRRLNATQDGFLTISIDFDGEKITRRENNASR